MNTFGQKLRVTTFGESHGYGVGCVIDGVPAGLKIDEEFVQSELDKRKPGKTKFETQRKEDDSAEIISGVFEGISTGAPIAIIIKNQNQKSKDYESIRELFRPGHADFAWFAKYEHRDHRGGGRSSARETAARVAAGAVAKLILNSVGIKIEYGVYSVGRVVATNLDFEAAKTSEIFALGNEDEMKTLIDSARNSHDSIGASVKVVAKNIPAGLGEPLYYKLDGAIGELLMGLNGVKAVEIGEGFNASKLLGSQNNDECTKDGFLSNHAGGTLGGMSSGQDLEVTVHFKPTPSIFKPLKTLTKQNEETVLELTGRHDPCIGIRGAVVAGSSIALILADMLLCNLGSKMEHLEKIYGVHI
ncbi:MAG: chorismate synthase [Pseudomonadota bacterium]|jgi:chorismate synthase